jgi:hypothetical protein
VQKSMPPARIHEKPYAVVPARKHVDPERPAEVAETEAAEHHQPARSGKRTPHAVRIYDTRTYHIPISVDRHHRKAMMPLWAQITIVLIGVAAMVMIGLVFEVVEF